MTFQGPQLTNRSDTTYHQQMSKGLEWGPSWGKFQPPRMNILGHEVWMDNDLILWDLPPAWLRFTRSEEKALGICALRGITVLFPTASGTNLAVVSLGCLQVLFHG